MEPLIHMLLKLLYKLECPVYQSYAVPHDAIFCISTQDNKVIGAVKVYLEDQTLSILYFGQKME